MNVALLHYHLNRGGVTQVIWNHLRSLQSLADGERPAQVAVLYGGRHEGWPADFQARLAPLAVESHVVPGLDYDDGQADAHGLAQRITGALRELGLQPADTILHIHNHALGKNVSLPGAITELAGNGYRTLLQIHDFAEDFRPANYRRLEQALAQGDPRRLAQVLYPQEGSIHYAVLTGRDRDLLQRCGFDPTRLHLLPNPVLSPGTPPSRTQARQALLDRFHVPPDRQLLLYPVRGIRRKNVGEAVLWSALAGEHTTVAITLPPINPVERVVFDQFVQLSGKLKLPCLFGVGAKGNLSFLENLAAADQILTTSVAEGFGMVFLESWLVDRPLIGRNLPDITRDFVARDVRFDHLHHELVLPLDWIGRERFLGMLERVYRRVLSDYGHANWPEDRWTTTTRQMADAGCVDFARLDFALQADVLEQVARDGTRRQQLREANPWLAAALRWSGPECDDTIRSNAAAVERGYSLQVAGPRLVRLYRTVLDQSAELPASPAGDGRRLLESLLDVERIHPIRLEIAAGNLTV